jgi:cold shock CspA family protein
MRPEQRGEPSAGRIVAMVVGHGHGFIRRRDRRDIFFHRSDVLEGVRFSELAVGDRVTFELIEDEISGPRAARVRRQRRDD